MNSLRRTIKKLSNTPRMPSGFSKPRFLDMMTLTWFPCASRTLSLPFQFCRHMLENCDGLKVWQTENGVATLKRHKSATLHWSRSWRAGLGRSSRLWVCNWIQRYFVRVSYSQIYPATMMSTTLGPEMRNDTKCNARSCLWSQISKEQLMIRWSKKRLEITLVLPLELARAHSLALPSSARIPPFSRKSPKHWRTPWTRRRSSKQRPISKASRGKI